MNNAKNAALGAKIGVDTADVLYFKSSYFDISGFFKTEIKV